MPKSLNVAFVEEIHRAQLLGRPISSAIAELNDATLAGMTEYACLKWALNSQIPNLPMSILQSEMAKQLSVASRALAITDPALPRRMDTIEIRPVEFLSLQDEDHIASKEVELFEIRFNRSAQSIGIASGVADQLQVALHEMIENAVIHSQSTVLPLAGYSVGDGRAQFCVAGQL